MGNKLQRSFQGEEISVRDYARFDEEEIQSDLRLPVRHTLDNGGSLWTVTADGKPVELYGAIPVGKDSANVWSHGEGWHRSSLSYLRLSRVVMGRLHKEYGLLFNIIEDPDEWALKWLGFLDCDLHHLPDKSVYFEYPRLQLPEEPCVNH